VLETALPPPVGAPANIVGGSDGAIWFTDQGGDRIGRIDTAGSITNMFFVGFEPYDIASAAGAGAPLWFTMPSADRIGRITTAGAITTFQLPGPPPGPTGPQGSAGPPGETRIGLVAFQVLPRRPRSGKRVLVRFALTHAARVTLRVQPLGKRRTSRRVAKANAKAGIGTIAWNGRLGKRPAKPGRYRLTVTATAGTSSASSSVTTKLRDSRK